MPRNLPVKSVQKIEEGIALISSMARLCVEFECSDGRYITVGGLWNPIVNRYTGEIPPEFVIPVTIPQFDALELVQEALRNPLRDHEHRIKSIILHGSRRSGKSMALFACALFIMLAVPAANIWIIGLRKRHGVRIQTLIRRHLHRENYNWNRHLDTLQLCNYSFLDTRSQVNYDADRGDDLNVVLYDESAFMKERVHEALDPSTAGRKGFAIHATSPNNPNWLSRQAERSKSTNPIEAFSIRTVHLQPEQNTFVSGLKEELEGLKYTLSDTGYRREALGEFVSDTGLVFPDFARSTHVKDLWEEVSKQGITDATDITARAIMRVSANDRRYDLPIEYMAGVDYNVNPSCASIQKIDNLGRLWVVGEVLSGKGTEDLGYQIEGYLQNVLGCESAHKQCVIIADSSGEWQDPRKYGQSSKILRDQGWAVFRPTGNKALNPRRTLRLDVARSLCRNAAGEVRFFVGGDCEQTINTCQELDISSNGLPNKSHTGNHLYDAMSYVFYRVWGTRLGHQIFGRDLVDQRLIKKILDTDGDLS